MSSLDIRGIDEQDLRTEPCPAAAHEFRVFLSEEAFDRAVERGAADTTREIGGVLVGELLRDDAGPYLRIDATVDALHADEKGAELTFTHATWEHINKEMDSRHRGKRVIGWYHTHPGFGVFLSDRDQFIHKSFFNLPFQVAFVYDPKTREHGLFSWRDDEVVRVRHYWIGRRPQVWDGARTDRVKQEVAPPPASDSRRDDAPRAEDSLGGSVGSLAMLGLLLLVLGGVCGRWLGSCSDRGELAASQVELAKAKADGAQMAIASLQGELIGVLRETVGDQAVRRPITQAVGELDAVIAAFGADATTTTNPLAQLAVLQLKAAREQLAQLLASGAQAEAVLGELERAARRGGALRADLAHDVAEQRSGLGGLYAELAIDAVKARDPERARRLLAVAAHLDPGNHARYEQQLRSFDQGASLPREVDTAPTGDQGDPR